MSSYTEIDDGFDEYMRLCEAIASSLFSEDKAGLAVYLDIERDEEIAIANFMGIDADSVTEYMLGVVRGLSSSVGDGAYWKFHQAWRKWRAGSLLETPPTLGILAIFSLAAENMGNHGSFGALAYYPRLAELTGLDRAQVETSYRKVCNDLWSGLSDWLTEWDGERGIPTVSESGSHPYVGKAISQALIRKADRDSLSHLFSSYGLEPQQVVDAEDMLGYLGEWIPKHGTVHIKSLWKKDDLHESIAQAAATALQTWVGIQGIDGKTQVPIRLTAQLHRVIRSRIELNIDILHPNYSESRDLELLTAGGEWEIVRFAPTGSRSLGLFNEDIFDSQSLLEGKVRIRELINDLEGLRTPRSVVPLKLDEVTGCYVEVDRVVLGIKHIVLTKERLTNEKLTEDGRAIANSVRRILEAVGRPGWSEVSELPGLPKGWTLFQDVEICGAVPQEGNFALRVLVPNSSTTVVMSGGLRIPGAIRRWSSLKPPEVLVISDSDEQFFLKVIEVTAESLVWESTANGRVAAFDLTAALLGDGDYEIQVHIGDSVRTLGLRLRSGSTQATRVTQQLAYRIEEVAGERTSAKPYDPTDGDSVIRGAEVIGPQFFDSSRDDDSRRKVLPVTPIWADHLGERSDARVSISSAIEVERVPTDSCSNTGAHLISNLPVWTGRVSGRFIEGQCKDCGVVKSYPARPRYKQQVRGNPKKKETATPAINWKISEILSDRQIESSPDWDAVFDTICHIGSGSFSDLDQLASQIEGTLLTSDRLIRGLESLAHIDVSYSTITAKPDRWCVAPPVLAGITDKVAVLSGFRSRMQSDWIRQRVFELGGRYLEIPNDGMPLTIRIEFSEREKFETLSNGDSAIKGTRLRYVPGAGKSILSSLPPLSEFLESLPRTRIPAYRKLERWDHRGTVWEAINTSEREGAYRYSGYGVVYGYRTPADIQHGLVAVCSPYLLKHLVANLWGETLLAFDPETETLISRMGAELPTLFGRSAVLCSGLLPLEDKSKRAIAYGGISADFADQLGKLLLS